MISRIKAFFHFQEFQTDLQTECLAGLSTFLSMAYIFVVNPAILGEGGINRSAALFATVLVSATATIVMGLWAKKPFALAPGLEINGYVVYALIIGMGISWQASLGAVFWSGILFLVLTITNVRQKIIEAIPNSLKTGLAASVGVFLIIIALRLSDILVYDKTNLSDFGNPIGYKGLILFTGLAIAVGLRFYRSRYFILISIVICSLLSHWLISGPASGSTVAVGQQMFSAAGRLDISAITDLKLIGPMITLFVLDFYGSIAKFIGLTKNTSIMKNGVFPNMKEALLIDGAATTAGACLGTTSIVAFVESGVGIGAGGRTGLTAVVCGFLMLLFIPLAPIVNFVPVIATTGALLWVGLEVMPKRAELRQLPPIELTSVLVMILITAFTFALDKAMLAGFGVYVVGMLLNGKRKSVSVYLIISVIIILTSTLLSFHYGKP